MNDEIKNNDIIEYIISEESKGLRVDQGIAKENKQFSRSLIQKWIKNGNIKFFGFYTILDLATFCAHNRLLLRYHEAKNS